MTAELAAQVMSVPSFESVQELGEAWHTIAGWPREVLSDASTLFRYWTFIRILPTAVPILRLPCSLVPTRNVCGMWSGGSTTSPQLGSECGCGSFPVTIGKRSSSCLLAKGILAVCSCSSTI